MLSSSFIINLVDFDGSVQRQGLINCDLFPWQNCRKEGHSTHSLLDEGNNALAKGNPAPSRVLALQADRLMGSKENTPGFLENLNYSFNSIRQEIKEPG